MSSVKVVVRLRPFNSREVSNNSKRAVMMNGNQTIIEGGPQVRIVYLSALAHALPRP